MCNITKKIELQSDKLYYGFPIVLLGYKDEKYGFNYTAISSSYTLGDLMVVGLYQYGNAIQQIKSAKCFTVNIPDETLMAEIEIGGFNASADKFKLAKKLTFAKSKKMDAPIIHECVLNIECEVVKIQALDEFEHYCHVFAKVKGRLVAEHLQENGAIKRDQINPILYIGDDKQRSYRFLSDKTNDLGDFTP